MAAVFERLNVQELCCALPSLHGEIANKKAPVLDRGFFVSFEGIAA